MEAKSSPKKRKKEKHFTGVVIIEHVRLQRGNLKMLKRKLPI